MGRDEKADLGLSRGEGHAGGLPEEDVLGDLRLGHAKPEAPVHGVIVEEPRVIGALSHDVEVGHDDEPERAARGDDRGRSEDVLGDDVAFFGREVGRPPEVGLEFEVEADRELVLGHGARDVPGQADATPAGAIGLADFDPRPAATRQFGSVEARDALAVEFEDILRALAGNADGPC